MKIAAMLLVLVFAPAAHAQYAMTGSSNAFTAENDFLSTVTVQGYSNMPVFLSSQSFTGVTSSTFSLANATGSAVVDCDISIVQVTTAGDLRMALNADYATGDYGYTAAKTTAGTVAGATTNSADYIDFLNGLLVKAGSPLYTHFSYGLNQAATMLPLLYNSSLYASTTAPASLNGAAIWRMTNQPSTAVIFTSAGTMTGEVQCYVKNY